MMPRILQASVLLIATALASWPAGAVSGGEARNTESTGSPRLVVMLVVDQMRADYLDTFEHRWKGGIATLLHHGAVFDAAEYPYMNTVTCAGHATIATGTLPRTHGMILNAWWDREQHALVTCTDDPSSPLISYGGRTSTGASGRLLRAATFADELRAAHPGSRVVSLALKPRSAIGLAGHGGTVVTWIDDVSSAFATSRAFAPAPVASVRAFLRETPYAAEAAWTLAATPDSYRYPDSNPFARPSPTQTGLFPHRLQGPRTPAAAAFALWQASPFSDAYLAQMAARMIDEYQLGRREDTDVLAVSFSALDMIGHAYGPESREVEDALIRLDATIGALIAKLDSAVGRDRYVLAFTSDHGVAPIPAAAGAARIATDDIRERIEETLVTHFGAPGRAGGGYVENVTFNNVYLSGGTWSRLSADDDAWRGTERAVLALPGVARLLRADRLDPHASDVEIRAAALSFAPDRSGDLIVVTKPQWTLGPRAEQSATTHGTGHPYDRRVPLIFFGAGIRPAQLSTGASPADIAPTLGALAGVAMKRVEGRVLSEVFAPAEP